MAKLEGRKAELLKEASRELRSRVEIERQKDVQELLDEEAVDDASVWSFLIYTSKKALNKTQRRTNQSSNLDFVSGSGFDYVGISVGDSIYVVTASEGDLFLVGRMQVGGYLNYQQAKERLKEAPPRVQEYLWGRQGTRIRLDRKLPSTIVRRLRFHGKGGADIESTFGLRFVSGTKVDVRALRGVRRLTNESAALLKKAIARRLIP